MKKTKGNQVTDYGYNIENRLSEVKEDNTPLANYGYDPFGRRLWKEVEGVKTYFLYSDEGFVGEYDENGVEIKGYGYLPDSFWTSDPLFQTQNGSYYWYQNDQLGTPQKLTDNQGNIVWEAHYKAFGEAQVETDLIDNPLRFPGQYFDTETELHYNYQRDYDPSTGRYLQFDPIGLEGGLNGYLYAHSDPVNLYDPTGEIAPIIGIAATQYARCLAACAATNVIANAIGGAACGFVENNCWSSCLNPLNWGGRRPKLGKPRKSSPPESCSLPNSFSAGTLVHTEKGLKPIEDIQIGEKVLSMDENTGKTSYQVVTDLIKGERQYRLIEITLDSGKSIEATADHPFYIKGKGWNPASSLKVGQVLELHNGTTVVVEEVLTRVRRDLVYNLTVANTHNYFVGEDGVLVHNCRTKELVDEAHNVVLAPGARGFKTTAVGRRDDGSLCISSSDNNYMPKSQRDWAEKCGIEVITGPGHAEEKLVHAGATHIDVSRHICLDCETLMKSKCVTTNTPCSGKKSKNRMSCSQQGSLF